MAASNMNRMGRIVAVSPCASPQAPDGASRYTGQLARALGTAGMAGHWYATTAPGATPTSAWSNHWPSVMPAGLTTIDQLRVTRLDAIDRLPRLTWRIATRLLVTLMQPRIQRARERAHAIGPQAWHEVVWPTWVEAYVLAGLGPHTPPLLNAFEQTLGQSAAALIAYPPLGLAARACAIAARARRPFGLITLFHDEDPLNSLPTWVRHYQQAAALLALTETEARTLRDLFHHPNVKVIGAGIDTDDLYRPSIAGDRFREAHRLGSRPLALYLGRKEGGKNYALAIEAVRRARTADPSAQDLQLVLIGADVDHRRVDPADGLYLGALPREDVLDALDACTILINPSTSESFGLTLLEAWARRKPVLAHAACAPFQAIVTDGVDGWLAPDAVSMAARLGEVTAQPELGRRMGEAGYLKLNKTYTWPAVAQRTLDALGDIARPSGAEL